MRVLTGMMLFFAACQGSTTTVEPKAPIRIQGSDELMSKLLPALVEEFRRTRADVLFEVSKTGSRPAIDALLDGETDAVATSAVPRPSDEEQAKVLHFSFRDDASKHIVAVDVIGVAVHAANPIDSLTYDQVISVFCSKRAASWADFGMDDRPIQVVVPEPDSGPRMLFEDFFCGPRGIHGTIAASSPDAVRAALKDNKDVISFVSASDQVGKLVALTPNPEIPALRPTQDNIIRGAYPLYGDLYLYTRGEPKGNLADFLSFIDSPAGQEVVDEQRFVPLFLRPVRLDEPRPLRETIHFEVGSSVPDARSLARLDLLVQELRERQLRHVVLEGYTDSNEDQPFRLAEQRAHAVRELIRAQVPELYFEIIPRGPKNPIAPNHTPYGRQVNRRVQVYLAEDERPEPPGEAGN